MEKKRKQEKRAQRGTFRDGSKNCCFLRNVTGNRAAIEAQILSTRVKKKTKKKGEKNIKPWTLNALQASC